MAWIRILEEEDATGRLKDVYSFIKGKRGKVGNLAKVQSLNPQAMKAHSDFFRSIMVGPSSLSREDRELLATVVSAINKCDYCVLHHGEALNYYWNNKDLIKQLIENARSMHFPQKTRTMLNYAIKLTERLSSMTPEDIERLRKVGFSDEDILNINLVTSYYNFENRVAEGLGVKHTTEEIKGYMY